MNLEVQSKYYSFDVFDTLVYRLARSPREVFSFISRNQDVRKITTNFVDVRVNSENLSRREVFKTGYKETNLNAIYDVFQRLTNCTDDEREFVKSFEVSTELEFIKPTHYGVSILAKLRKENIRYVLTSDMYMPESVILKILEKCGIFGFEKLFISSEYGKTKHHGDLYNVVVDHFAVAPADIMHIGDNEHADITMARHSGLRAELAPSSTKFQHFRKYRRKDTALISGWQPITQAFISQYFEDLEISGRSCEKDWTDDEYYETFGECVLAPLMVSYIFWMRDHAVAKRVEHMNFMARDGKFMQQVFEYLFGDEIPSSYVAGSRRMTTLPFSLLSSSTIRSFIDSAVFNSSTVGEIYDKLGTGPALEAHLDTFGLYRNKVLDRALRNEFIDIVSENSGIFLRSFEEEREEIQKYYRTHFPSGRVTGLVDIGWRGSLQRALFDCLPDIKKNEIQGFYLATTTDAYEILDGSGCEHEGFICRNGIFPHPYLNVHILTDVFEFLMSSDHGSVLGLNQDGTWRHSKLGDGELSTMKIALKIQQAALNAIIAMRNKIGVDGIRKLIQDYDPSDFWTVIFHPSRFDALKFKNVKIFSGIGDTEGEYLTNFLGDNSMYRNYRSSCWPNAYAASLTRFQRKWVNLRLKMKKLPKIYKS